MNRLTIIGNITKDPQIRSTTSGDPVCQFTVAVSKRQSAKAGQPDADFFRVTAWRKLAEICGKYLGKGKKVAVVGSVSVSTYMDQKGEMRASLDVVADDVEFLSPKDESPSMTPQKPVEKKDKQTGFVEVQESLPF